MSQSDRLEIYQRVRAYRENPNQFVREWDEVTAETRNEIIYAREILKSTVLEDQAIEIGLKLVQMLDIDSHRAEYTLFEAARAHAAADGRESAGIDDVRAVAPMALRQRRSEFMVNFYESQRTEDEHIRAQIDALHTPN
jgi:magnesium chelatase subunit I